MFETITGSEVVGVSKFASYQACLSCKNKVNPGNSDSNGTCSKCGMKQKLSRCPKQLRATMIVTTPGGGYLEVTAFGKHLEEIAGTDRVDEDALIEAKPFNFSHNLKVISTVSRDSQH